jgi:hypothetical protein
MSLFSTLLMFFSVGATPHPAASAPSAPPAPPAAVPSVSTPTTAAPVMTVAQNTATPATAVPVITQTAPPKDPEVLQGRQRPGQPKTYPDEIIQTNPGAVRAPPPEAFPKDQIPVPDRWRLSAGLSLVNPRYYDPYNQNVLKGDIPLKGTKDWFVELNGISDTLVQPFSIPTPVNAQSRTPGIRGAFGRDNDVAIQQTFITGVSLIKGSTAFKPPDFSINLDIAFNYNYATAQERGVLSVNSTRGHHRTDGFIGLQGAFIEYHLRDVSSRYDFDAVRVGIQPFSSDFRGFLFQDDQLGIRFFGDRDDNRFQYNLAFFARLNKDTNSGLNDLTVDIREDYIGIANLYRQDFPVPGFTSQVTAIYNANREGDKIDFNKNGFPVIPALIGNDRARNYDVVYLGYNADGHIGRFNLTGSIYGAFGQDRKNIFTGKSADIRSYFIALEPSYDIDWIRLRLSGIYASGDGKPHSNTEGGFDAILENPQIAGSDTSYFINEAIPFISGGGVAIKGPNGVLLDLRSSKDEGQSNFANPGTILLGGGADFDVLPQLRVSANINHVSFANTAVVEALRQQGSISPDLGWDYSVATIYRPWQTQNIIFRVSGAVFMANRGFNDLFTTIGHDTNFYQVALNAIFTF